jgi:hypothetical protein
MLDNRMTDELERTQMEVAKALKYYSPGETEENHKNFGHDSGLRFEPSTSQIQVKSITFRPTRFIYLLFFY